MCIAHRGNNLTEVCLSQSFFICFFLNWWGRVFNNLTFFSFVLLQLWAFSLNAAVSPTKCFLLLCYIFCHVAQIRFPSRVLKHIWRSFSTLMCRWTVQIFIICSPCALTHVDSINLILGMLICTFRLRLCPLCTADSSMDGWMDGRMDGDVAAWGWREWFMEW